MARRLDLFRKASFRVGSTWLRSPASPAHAFVDAWGATLPTMGYQHDAEASAEADRYRACVPSRALDSLGEACSVDPDVVLGQTVCFDAARWAEQLHSLGGEEWQGCIARGDVRRVADKVTAGRATAADLFTASYIWGMGDRGYGPRRYSNIVAEADGRLDAVFDHAWALVRSDHPVVAYRWFGGEREDRGKSQTGDEASGRLPGYGPAFFTKFLYFAREDDLGTDEGAAPHPLILDLRLARAVTQLSGMPYLVRRDGRAVTWTAYRYAVYLHWMHGVAADLGVGADLLELTLFRKGAPAENNGDAGWPRRDV